MTEPKSSRLPSTATMALVAAGVLAAASAGVALMRSDGGAETAAGPHGSVKPAQPVAPIETKIRTIRRAGACSAGPISKPAT